MNPAHLSLLNVTQTISHRPDTAACGTVGVILLGNDEESRSCKYSQTEGQNAQMREMRWPFNPFFLSFSLYLSKLQQGEAGLKMSDTQMSSQREEKDYIYIIFDVGLNK